MSLKMIKKHVDLLYSWSVASLMQWHSLPAAFSWILNARRKEWAESDAFLSFINQALWVDIVSFVH